MQVHNSIDCSGGPQQITSVQVDNNDLQKAVCSFNLRQRKAISIVCHWARNKLKQINSVQALRRLFLIDEAIFFKKGHL